MWERFTERAKHVVSAAREEASRLGSEYVRTEHILLGLCREPEGIAARALENLQDKQLITLQLSGYRQRFNRIEPRGVSFTICLQFTPKW